MMPSRRHSGIGRRSACAGCPPAAGAARPFDGAGAAASRVASSASTSASRGRRAPPAGVVLVGEVARLALTVGVGQGALQELPLVGQVPALVAGRAVRAAPPGRFVDAHDTDLFRLQRTEVAAPAPEENAHAGQGAGAEDDGDDPDERDAAGVGRDEQDRLAVLGHEGLVDVGVGLPGRHHALDLMAHRDGRGGVGLRHREVGAGRAAHAGLEGGGALARRRRRRVQRTAADHQRDDQDGHRQGHAGPERQRGPDAQPPDAPAWSVRAAFRNESRFFCVAGPTSTAVTGRPG